MDWWIFSIEAVACVVVVYLVMEVVKMSKYTKHIFSASEVSGAEDNNIRRLMISVNRVARVLQRSIAINFHENDLRDPRSARVLAMWKLVRNHIYSGWGQKKSTEKVRMELKAVRDYAIMVEERTHSYGFSARFDQFVEWELYKKYIVATPNSPKNTAGQMFARIAEISAKRLFSVLLLPKIWVPLTKEQLISQLNLKIKYLGDFVVDKSKIAGSQFFFQEDRVFIRIPRRLAVLLLLVHYPQKEIVPILMNFYTQDGINISESSAHNHYKNARKFLNEAQFGGPTPDMSITGSIWRDWQSYEIHKGGSKNRLHSCRLLTWAFFFVEMDKPVENRSLHSPFLVQFVHFWRFPFRGGQTTPAAGSHSGKSCRSNSSARYPVPFLAFLSCAAASRSSSSP